jgi:hypothetical protein
MEKQQRKISIHKYHDRFGISSTFYDLAILNRAEMIAGFGELAAAVSDWWIEWTGQFQKVDEHETGKGTQLQQFVAIN